MVVECGVIYLYMQVVRRNVQALRAIELQHEQVARRQAQHQTPTLAHQHQSAYVQ